MDTIRAIRFVGTIVVFTAHALLVPATHGEIPRIDRVAVLGDVAPFVKAYLYQDFITRNGRELTAAVFADRDTNSLAAARLIAGARAEQIRRALEIDLADHKAEYSVRAHIAQADTR